MGSQPADAYAKAQDDERQVLKAIFMEDFEEAEAKGAWSVGSAFLLQLYVDLFIVLSFCGMSNYDSCTSSAYVNRY